MGVLRVRSSMFTVDFESCSALLDVYNAGAATEMVGGQYGGKR